MNRLRRIASPFAVVLLTASFSACSKPAERHAWTVADPWFAPAPIEPGRQLWPEVPGERVFVVPAEQVAAAVERLRDAPALLLTREQAFELQGRKKAYVWSGKPVLVRGLVLNRGTGAFTVRERGRQLSVHHGSLGREPVPMERQPIIVYLEEVPETVWVSVSMAE